MKEPYVTERSKGVIGWVFGGCAFWLLVALAIILFACGVSVSQATTNYQTDPKVAQQHTLDSCLLGAVATAMNYKSGGVNYTSAGLALAYRLKYHADNWAQDGTTSHNAQTLAGDAGFKPHYGRLTVKDNGLPEGDPVGALKYLAWIKHYPVVFLNGSPQHALVVLDVVNGDKPTAMLIIADPLDGRIYQESPESLYKKLENQKWYFALD